MLGQSWSFGAAPHHQRGVSPKGFVCVATVLGHSMTQAVVDRHPSPRSNFHQEQQQERPEGTGGSQWPRLTSPGPPTHTLGLGAHFRPAQGPFLLLHGVLVGLSPALSTSGWTLALSALVVPAKEPPASLTSPSQPLGAAALSEGPACTGRAFTSSSPPLTCVFTHQGKLLSAHCSRCLATLSSLAVLVPFSWTITSGSFFIWAGFEMAS